MGDEAFHREIAAAREFHRERHGTRDPDGENRRLARIIVDSERAERNRADQDATDDPPLRNSRARDDLLLYARQDAAHALLNTGSLLSEVIALRRQVRALTALVGLLVVAALGVLGLAAWALRFVR